MQGRAGEQIRRSEGRAVHSRLRRHVQRPRRHHLGGLTTVANNAFTNRKPMLIVIDSIGWLGAMLIIGAVLGALGPAAQIL